MSPSQPTPLPPHDAQPNAAVVAAAEPERATLSRADADRRLEDLAQIIHAYNDATDKLQQSHETLKREVLRLRRELASTNAQLQRSKRLSALGEMAAGIAHEVRNPLAAIGLYAAMIGDDLASLDTPADVSSPSPVLVREADQAPKPLTSARDNTRKIADAVRGLNAIVEDVLYFSREIKPRKTAVD